MSLLVLELNEFNHKILSNYSKKFNFRYIKKILNFHHSKTTTKDTYLGDNNQFGYLDPWSQWVSIHTLTNSKKHKIKNLGDIPELKIKQIWELKKNIDFYIWGPMNASRRGSKNVKLFFPDPWVYSEKAFPKNFNKILEPIKVSIKSRGNINILKKITFSCSVFYEFTKYLGILEVIKLVTKTFFDFIKYNKNYVFFCNWEYLCLKVLINIIKNKKNFISLYFINSLAHVQHHYWREKKYSHEIFYCLKYFNKMVEHIYKNKNFNLLIINGFSQKNSEREKLCLYEQKSHSKLLKKLGIEFHRIEKLMTNDAFIFFKNNEEANKCKQILKSMKFQNRNIFHIENINNKKIFYKTNFIKKVKKNEFISGPNYKLKFLDYFSFVTLRRGIHTKKGDILSEREIFPKEIENHNIFKKI